jgi:hypothetical protein
LLEYTEIGYGLLFSDLDNIISFVIVMHKAIIAKAASFVEALKRKAIDILDR